MLHYIDCRIEIGRNFLEVDKEEGLGGGGFLREGDDGAVEVVKPVGDCEEVARVFGGDLDG